MLRSLCKELGELFWIVVLSVWREMFWLSSPWLGDGLSEELLRVFWVLGLEEELWVDGDLGSVGCDQDFLTVLEEGLFVVLVRLRLFVFLLVVFFLLD
jgi:hypothetical protein